jgi:hypothetical protein
MLLLVGGVALTIDPSRASAGQQSENNSREIVSDDFVKNRKKATGSKPASAVESQATTSQTPITKNLSNPRRYRLASSSLRKPPRRNAGRVVEQLGITLWKLSPAKPNDSGARMLVIEGGESSEWVPKRIEADTPLNFGDRIRLTIESPRSGHLYIIDREVYVDGSKGDAYLIFPTLRTRGGDNEVSAGQLIDIPGQEDPPFKATRNRADQVGELLTIIVTTSPLELPISQKPLKISAAQIEEWERTWTAPVERFEMIGGSGQSWTEKEKEAGGSIGARQLTQDEPAPQTIYHILTRTRNAMFVNLSLRYR